MKRHGGWAHEGSRGHGGGSGGRGRGHGRGGGRGAHSPAASALQPSAAFLRALEEQRAAEAARAAAAAAPASSVSEAPAPPEPPPAAVPRGFYWDAQRNRLFKLNRGAPAEFVAQVVDERAQAAAAAAAAHVSSAQAALRAGRARLPRALMARELSGSTPSGIPADWAAQLRRCRVGAWRHSAVSVTVAPPYQVHAGGFPIPWAVRRYVSVAVHPSLGTLLVCGQVGMGPLVDIQAAPAPLVRCDAPDAIHGEDEPAGGLATNSRELCYRYPAATDVESGDESPRAHALDVSPCTHRLLCAAARLGSADSAGAADIYSYASYADAVDGRYKHLGRATLPRGRGSLWNAQWVADDALALAASTDSPSLLLRLRPDGSHVREATIVDDGVSDVFTFGLAHVDVGGGGHAQHPHAPVLYVGRRNGDVLLWDARQGANGAITSSGDRSSSAGAPPPATQRVMHVPSSVVAVQPTTWPLVVVADADETLQLRDCRKSSVPVTTATGYRNSPRRLPVVVSPDRRFVAAACAGADGVVRTWDHRLTLLHTSTRAERAGGDGGVGGDGGAGAAAASSAAGGEDAPSDGGPPQIALLPSYGVLPTSDVAPAASRRRDLGWPALVVAEGGRLGLLH